MLLQNYQKEMHDVYDFGKTRLLWMYWEKQND